MLKMILTTALITASLSTAAIAETVPTIMAVNTDKGAVVAYKEIDANGVNTFIADANSGKTSVFETKLNSNLSYQEVKENFNEVLKKELSASAYSNVKQALVQDDINSFKYKVEYKGV